MLKKSILFIMIHVVFSATTIAAAYGRMPEDFSTTPGGFSSVLRLAWSLVASPKPPTEIPEFRPVPYTPTFDQQKKAAIDRTMGLTYLEGSKISKNIPEGLRLLNAAAELGQGDACHDLDAIFRYGKYELPVDIALAEAYKRNIKWYSPGESLGPVTTAAAPVPASGGGDSRRPSGGSDGPPATSASGGKEPASELRHRHAAAAAGEKD